MGREIRRVIANWEHPQETKYNHFRGREETSYVPLYDESYLAALTEWIRNHQLWEKGQHPDQLEQKTDLPRYFAEWDGDPPEVERYRPDWKPEEMTWWQVYETVSEGTPVTPPFATQEELVEYLVQHGDFRDQQRRKDRCSTMECSPWPREAAERFVYRTQSAPSLISNGGTIMAGHLFPSGQNPTPEPQ